MFQVEGYLQDHGRQSIKITQALDCDSEGLGLIPGPGTVLEIWSLTSPLVGINLRCVIQVASNTSEAVFCRTRSFSVVCERSVVDEHLRWLQLSGVDLVTSCTGSFAFKLIVFFGEGEVKFASLISLFTEQRTLIELSEY